MISKRFSFVPKQAFRQILFFIMLVNISFEQWILMGNTEGITGGWDKLTTFPSGYYLSGIALKNESPCGDCDDTASNGIKAYYCNL